MSNVVQLVPSAARNRKAVKFMTDYLKNRAAFDDKCPEYALKMAVMILEGRIDYNPVSRSFSLNDLIP